LSLVKKEVRKNEPSMKGKRISIIEKSEGKKQEVENPDWQQSHTI